jgi:hypothetical protein
MDIRKLYRRWVRLGTLPVGLTARAVLACATLAPIPRCQCLRPVGPANPIRERVGPVITACATCAVPTPLQGEGCNCWVRDRPAEERFSIRYGAHDVRCPMWAPSQDPVDAANDAELRLRLDR